MIMPRGQQLLLPANPLFVLFTLLTALFANMVVNISLVGNAAWMPDFLALVLVFWCVHQPRLVGIGVAFFFGVATDVHQAALLGQHAMSYTAWASWPSWCTAACCGSPYLRKPCRCCRSLWSRMP
jgi:rod shape-determining protein MreD